MQAVSTVCYGCHGERACFEVGDNLAGGDKGSIGTIAYSCNGIKACHYAALDGGDINSIVHSCNAEDANGQEA